jgi:hypothetical protein
MKENRKSLLGKQGPNLLSPIEPSELLDIFVNKGILHEANRTFFNPLGYVLRLDETDNCLRLDKSDREEGPVMSTLDRMAITAYRNFCQPRHEIRQKFWGFIIQVRDILRSEAVNEPAASEKTIRLRNLLKAVDQLAYAAKQKLMQYSDQKDGSLMLLDRNEQLGNLYMAMSDKDWASVVNYAAILSSLEAINIGIAEVEHASRHKRKEQAMEKFASELGVDIDSDKDNRKPHLKQEKRDKKR